MLEKQLADWILSPRAKERGVGCGAIISEARYAEMRHEIEEERRATDAAAKLLAEEVIFPHTLSLHAFVSLSFAPIGCPHQMQPLTAGGEKKSK